MGSELHKLIGVFYKERALLLGRVLSLFRDPNPSLGLKLKEEVKSYLANAVSQVLP